MAERLRTIKEHPDQYRMGELAVKSHLPRRLTKSGNGGTIAFDSSQGHQQYIRQFAETSINTALHKDKNIYASQTFPDGRQTIVAASPSPYTMGDHLVVWNPNRGPEFLQPTFQEMSVQQGEAAFAIVRNIAETFAETTGNFFIGANVQSSEKQRQSVQSIREVHFHAVRMVDEDVISFRNISSRKDLRDLADPFTNVSLNFFGDVIASKLKKEPDFSDHFSRDFSQKEYPFEYPKAHFFELKNGWDSLTEKGFFEFLQTMQKNIASEYQELVDCYVGENSKKRDTFRVSIGNGGHRSVTLFSRLMPQPVDVRIQNLNGYFERHPEISESLKRKLIFLARQIKPASEVLLEDHARKNKKGDFQRDKYSGLKIASARDVNTRLIMKGESYNILFFPNQQKEGSVLMAIVPRITSGGSPLDAFGIKKTQYEVSDREFNQMMEAADRRRDTIVRKVLSKNPNLKPGPALKKRPTI